jgi:hypothetical protein
VTDLGIDDEENERESEFHVLVSTWRSLESVARRKITPWLV